jgi:hypothetical protein
MVWAEDDGQGGPLGCWPNFIDPTQPVFDVHVGSSVRKADCAQRGLSTPAELGGPLVELICGTKVLQRASGSISLMEMEASRVLKASRASAARDP